MLVFTFLLMVPVLGAAPVSEQPSDAEALWNRADAIADNSGSYLPGVRRISFEGMDESGIVVYTSQALELIASSHQDRYLAVRQFGDAHIFDLMDRYTDGFPLTPFNDNLHDMESTYTGVDEIIGERSAAVFSFVMAYDAALPYYDPNYRASGKIIGWDADEETFDHTIAGKVWIDRLSGAPLKMETHIILEDHSEAGTLSLVETVHFSMDDEMIYPTSLSTEGTLRILAGQGGRVMVTDFRIQEEQDSFWKSSKFAKGELVY